MSVPAAADEITSTRNPRVKQLAALARRKGRQETGRHLIEGPNAISSALAAGVVQEVLGTAEGLADLLTDHVVPAGVGVTQVSDHVLDRIVDVRTHQGVVGVAATTTAGLADVAGRGLLVVLDVVADPGNAGTIVRTADAAGATGVVLTTGSVDIFGPRAVRAAAGSTYNLPIVTDVALEEVVAACHAREQAVFGLSGSGARSIEELDRPAPLALVLGNEAHGLGRREVELMDGLLSIPIHGRAESLNVAAAAAIAIYLVARSVRVEG